MAYDEDDLFIDDFDFVDDDEDEAPAAEAADVDEEEAPAKPKRKSSRGGKRGGRSKASAEERETAEEEQADSAVEEEAAPEVPAVPTDHVVHVYEFGKYRRTIGREFTCEDAEAFAKEFNRTSAAHCREGIVGNKNEEPAQAL